MPAHSYSLGRGCDGCASTFKRGGGGLAIGGGCRGGRSPRRQGRSAPILNTSGSARWFDVAGRGRKSRSCKRRPRNRNCKPANWRSASDWRRPPTTGHSMPCSLAPRASAAPSSARRSPHFAASWPCSSSGRATSASGKSTSRQLLRPEPIGRVGTTARVAQGVQAGSRQRTKRLRRADFRDLLQADRAEQAVGDQDVRRVGRRQADRLRRDRRAL